MNPTMKTSTLVIIALVVVAFVWYRFLRVTPAVANAGMTVVPGPASQSVPPVQATSPTGITSSKVPLSSVMNQ